MFHIQEKAISADNVVIPGKKALFVEDNCINIVSKHYKVVQPSEVVERFEKASGYEVSTCMENANTGGLLLSAKIQDFYVGNANHTASLSFYTGHNGKHTTLLALQGLNHACFNQIPMLIGCTNRHLIKTKHINAFDFDKLDEILCELPLHLSNFKIQYESLQDMKYTKDQFLEDFIKHFKIQDNAKRDSNVAKISSMYDNARGQSGLTTDSGYKAYQAVTYHLTHNARNGKNKLETVNIKNQDTAHDWFNVIKKAA